MGRRKRSRKIIVEKKKVKVPTTFKCPFCSHDGSVECTMDMDRRLGYLACRVCGAKYQAEINYLSEPVDVFCDWIDECERLADSDGALSD